MTFRVIILILGPGNDTVTEFHRRHQGDVHGLFDIRERRIKLELELFDDGLAPWFMPGAPEQ